MTEAPPTDIRTEAIIPQQKLPENAGYMKVVMFKPKRKDYLVRSLKVVLGRGTEDNDKFCSIVCCSVLFIL